MLWISSTLGGCASSPLSSEVAGTIPAEAATFNRARPSLSGWEVCKNGWDDNENGLIDEGCSVPQAAVAVYLSWSEPDADLDLLVFDPNGEVATVAAPTASGMSLALDCPGADECTEPYEMVHATQDEYLPGRYRVMVVAQKKASGSGPILAKLGIVTPETTEAYTLTFHETAQSVALDFFVAGSRQKE